MTNNDTNNPFDWLTVHPQYWATTPGVFPQKCPVCDEEMQGTIITNARGFYEHFNCAYNLFHEFWSIVP